MTDLQWIGIGIGVNVFCVVYGIMMMCIGCFYNRFIQTVIGMILIVSGITTLFVWCVKVFNVLY